ncbi:succinylglutamate desuccinylase/aspartoacylase family protein [Colwellia sp. BRX8-3]|jgi:predicted deacylase|nr:MULTISPECIES: succinylglutamate desuccinylase/aspartoacylase family protein [unclassified Colwellia]MBA6336687.1 succinylglutamate desuccinylase/aspartoacylase family protein [Colwellia sp. BRX8-7]MBA6348511.1 succinylglutamate desuccinylase/aspartoacylase family protein [Colwellia sp. BRX8-9]MBA6352357.1 succinylglutamate desuccinylase/aspartoacylase family protein [Colwellia sp. BRX9-1]MBA6356025.1 succinylglutamate desuccinylase/aspartoacylase family protein [Colwellia sp. BRX8-3]MBA6359|tara:strand:- start:2284 stop:3411 length:1128 start_codon:yes stop_codon:yes gene_type:complete
MNEIKKEVMHVGEMASGAALTVPVYRIKGRTDAPSVYIQANMHGAEVQGNAVIFQLLELLKNTKINGDITLVPYANPVGCNHKNGEYTLGRFDPITGVNWNRMYHFDESIIKPFVRECIGKKNQVIEANFKKLMIESIEEKLNHNIYGLTTGQRIAYQLQRLAHQADYVLDLHTGPISSKHLYCPEYAQESAQYFDIPHTLLIPNDFDGALDEATFCPWWSLQDAFAELGIEFSISSASINKESFTVELGSQEQIDLDVALEDAKSIMNYLQHKNVINTTEYRPKTMTRYGCYLKNYKAFYSPMGGMVDYLAEFGQPLAAGEPLARILRMDNYGDGDPLHYISLDKKVIPILHFASASVNQGTELYKVFSEYFEF